jgi:hypothetical protein
MRATLWEDTLQVVVRAKDETMVDTGQLVSCFL